MPEEKKDKTKIGFVDLGFGKDSSEPAKNENKSIYTKKEFGINLGFNKEIEKEKKKKVEV